VAGLTVDAGPVRAEIEAACERAGRDPAGVQLLAAVKYLEAADLGALADAGVTLLGENKAQALEDKVAATAGHGFRWHFIGRLQSRKVKVVLPLVELVHSVDSDSVLSQLERHGTPDTRVLVQVNVAREEGKAGVDPDALGDFIARCPVAVAGLMTMPPFAAEPEASRPHFRRLAELAAEHGLAELSMGTSQDFAVAVEEGATIVRVGSRLYRRSD
jgi:PLP dependent protein